MLSYIKATWSGVCAGTYCAAHNCTFEEYEDKALADLGKKENDLGIIGYTKKYPLRVKMMCAPLFLAVLGVSCVYKIMPVVYAVTGIWFVWSVVGDILTARRNYLTYSKLVKQWCEESVVFKLWGMKHMAFGISMLCVFSYSLICTAISAIIATNVL